MRRTSLTSDRLQRWLQELDGRRIFVVADACRAGGLHERGKSLDDPFLTEEQKDEPFLGDLLRRCKALDQKELALLAGCKADELSWVRNEGDLSVLTYFLIAELRAGAGALTLQQAYERIDEAVDGVHGREEEKGADAGADQPDDAAVLSAAGQAVSEFWHAVAKHCEPLEKPCSSIVCCFFRARPCCCSGPAPAPPMRCWNWSCRAGAAATLDGQDVGAKRRFEFGGLQPGPGRTHALARPLPTVKLATGRSIWKPGGTPS